MKSRTDVQVYVTKSPLRSELVINRVLIKNS